MRFMWYNGSMGYTGDKKREYQREWLKARRIAYLKDKSCIVCGSSDDLEVDHINPEQKVTHRVWSWAEVKRDAELEKCQILCYDHHKEKTKEYLKSKRSHGRTMYSYGCRCPVCYKAQQDHNKQRNTK